MDLKKSNSIYKDIVIEFKKYIDLGVYKHNDKLPSVRNLATELGINPNTVSRAYKVLEEDGYITTINKKGIYVSSKSLKEKEKKELIKKQVVLIKNNGVSKEEITKIILEVYDD